MSCPNCCPCCQQADEQSRRIAALEAALQRLLMVSLPHDISGAQWIKEARETLHNGSDSALLAYGERCVRAGYNEEPVHWTGMPNGAGDPDFAAIARRALEP